MPRNRTENWQNGLSVDFSAESAKKDAIKQELLQQLWRQEAARRNHYKEDTTMKTINQRRFKRSSAIALVACLTLVVVSATAYAITNYFNLGQNAQYMLNDRNISEAAAQLAEALPTQLQGLLYSQDGQPIETVGQMQNGVYNAAGEAVIITLDDAGQPRILTREEARREHAQITTLFNSLAEAQPYLAFTARAVGYIPEGYALEGYRLYNDENGQPYTDAKYLEMYFYQDNQADAYIYVQARLMDEETAFTTGGTGNMEQTSINGNEAIVDEGTIDILIGEVIYMIAASDLPQSEIIKLAESLTK